MKLDVTALRYLSKDHFRVLSAIEMGMKNHEIVPVSIITSIAKLRHGGLQKILSHLLCNSLIAHDANAYDGFRLTYSGFDFLALKTLLNRGHLCGLGRQIGVGKESDIFLGVQPDGTEVAVKFHRLGRTSFRAVKSKRDYLRGRPNSTNWFQLSGISALKEYTFLKALFAQEFPTPTPVDHNRHVIVMSLVPGYPLYQVQHIPDHAEVVYNRAMDLIVKLAQCGLVHCDFNEFNLMIDDDGTLTMIDFPQMISTAHANATELFNRDVSGLVTYFSRLQKGNYVPESVPTLSEIVVDETKRIDVAVKASGFDEQLQQELSAYYRASNQMETSAPSGCPGEEECHQPEEEEVVIPANSISISEDELRNKVRQSIERKVNKVNRMKRNASKLSVKGKLKHKMVI